MAHRWNVFTTVQILQKSISFFVSTSCWIGSRLITAYTPIQKDFKMMRSSFSLGRHGRSVLGSKFKPNHSNTDRKAIMNNLAP